MTATKKQEIEALNQIKDIIEKMGGKNSYIGTAFDGCIEIAERNIENDFGCSLKEECEAEYQKNKQLADENQMLRSRVALFEMDLKEATDTNARLLNEKSEAEKNWRDLSHSKALSDQKIKELETEIIKLKAKLYDYMVKEEK